MTRTLFNGDGPEALVTTNPHQTQRLLQLQDIGQRPQLRALSTRIVMDRRKQQVLHRKRPLSLEEPKLVAGDRHGRHPR